MALTKAHNRMIESAPVNIVDFGADPTGATDSASAIQTALDTNKNVFVPVGNFKIGSTLQFTRTNQVFFGESGNAVNAVTTTSPASAVGVSQIFTESAILMFSFNDKQGVQIKDVVFNGTGVATGGVAQVLVRLQLLHLVLSFRMSVLRQLMALLLIRLNL